MKVINKLWNKFLGYLEDKKIYRTYDGALFAGVCSGISKRFGISLSLVRVLFLLTGIAFYWQSINTVLLASNSNASRTKKTKL